MTSAAAARRRGLHDPRICLFDIETAPSLGWFFDLWKEGNIIDTKQDWYVLSFAYKWLGEKKTTVHALPDYGLYKRNRENDKTLLKDLWGILDEADVVVAHNGDRFDIRKANARFLAHGFKPPSPYKTVDTLKVARRHFKFDSNKLNDLGRYLKVGRKLPHTGSHLWFGCMHGDSRAWRLMRRYNARDVDLLEQVYLKIRPWATNHPSLTWHTRKHEDCPVCQSNDTIYRGWNLNRTGRKRRINCRDCGYWFSGPHERLRDAR